LAIFIKKVTKKKSGMELNFILSRIAFFVLLKTKPN